MRVFAGACTFWQVRASVNQKLEESGEKEKLKELLRKKLIERGWRDELKEYCKEVCLHRRLSLLFFQKNVHIQSYAAIRSAIALERTHAE